MSIFTKYPSSAKWIIAVLLLLNVLCLVVLWLGRPKGQHHQKRHQKFIHQVKKEIPFDTQQLTVLDSILIKHRLEQKKLHDSIRTLRIDLLDAMTSGDEKALTAARAFAEQIGNLNSQRELNAIAHFAEIKRLCNPEQQEILTGIMTKEIEKHLRQK